jgi:hypothetical protein
MMLLTSEVFIYGIHSRILLCYLAIWPHERQLTYVAI